MAPWSLTPATITVTDAERDRLRARLARSAADLHACPLDDEGLLGAAAHAGRSLPERLLDTLERFREPGNTGGAILIRNLPLDDEAGPTPADGYLGHWSALPVATFVQLAVTSVVGEVIGYADEKSGNLIQDIVPIAGARERQENSGTVYLELHTEDGFHPHKPEFVTLLCIRPDHERAGTTVVGAVHDALPLLSPACEAVLREPLFRLRVSSSFGGRSDDMTGPIAVLSGPPHDLELIADFNAMEPQSDSARHALHELKRAMLALLQGAQLEAGDLLVVDNRAAVHGRTAFLARYDGNDRWLRRCLAVSDLDQSREARPAGSRVLRPVRPTAAGRTESQDLA